MHPHNTVALVVKPEIQIGEKTKMDTKKLAATALFAAMILPSSANKLFASGEQPPAFIVDFVKKAERNIDATSHIVHKAHERQKDTTNPLVNDPAAIKISLELQVAPIVKADAAAIEAYCAALEQNDLTNDQMAELHGNSVLVQSLRAKKAKLDADLEELCGDELPKPQIQTTLNTLFGDGKSSEATPEQPAEQKETETMTPLPQSSDDEEADDEASDPESEDSYGSNWPSNLGDAD